MAKKNALGRGLDMIFSENSVSSDTGGVTKLRISDVEPKDDQPRKSFDGEALEQLAASIAENGVLQPILVRETGRGTYQIIAGERRWRASKLAELTEIPAMIIEADDLKTAQLALIENLQREDLNALEEAEAYHALLTEFELTQEEVSERLGKSRSAVANSLRLLEMPGELAGMLRAGELSAGHCRALLGLRDKGIMPTLAQRVVARKLSVRETEAAVRAANHVKSPPRESGVTVDYIAELERRVTSETGRYCRISVRGARKTVSLEYDGESDLEELLRLICKKDITE